MGPLGGRRVPDERRQNNLGLVRTQDVDGIPDGRRVLLLGDSHLMGVVDNADNAGDVLERALRAQAGDPHASVYDAACGNYSLYQYVLRARTLVDALRPDTIVAVISSATICSSSRTSGGLTWTTPGGASGPPRCVSSLAPER